MAITKSAKKALRQSLRKRSRNIKEKRELKNLLKKVGNLITRASAKREEEGRKLLPKIYKVLDKAAKIGLIKKNTASRKKSRITKAITRIPKSP